MTPTQASDPPTPAASPTAGRPGAWAAAGYGVAAAAVAVGVAVRWSLEPLVGPTVPFLTLFPAVVFAAWWAGTRAGLAAVGLGAAAALWLFVEPAGEFRATDPRAGVGVALFAATGAFVAVLVGRGEAARRQLAVTLSSIGDAVVATDADGRVTFLNPVAEGLTGWPAGDAVGRPLADVFRIVNETTGAAVGSPVARVLATGKVVGLANHTALIGRDGTSRPIADTAAPIRGPDGRLTGVVLVFRDVSAERQVERQVRDSEERLRRTLESITDGLVTMDRDWRFTYANPRAERILGMPAHQLVGRDHWEAFPAAVGTDIEANYRRAMAADTATEFEAYYAPWDRWFAVTAYPSADGLTVYFRDITAAKRAADRERAADRRLRLFADAVPALISYVDAGHVYRFVNRQYEVWFGLPADAYEGRHVRDMLGDAAHAQMRPYMARALGGERFSYEGFVPYRDQGGRHVHIDYVPLADGGRVDGYFALITDISARKQAEAVVRRQAAIFEHQTDAIIVTDLDGRIVDWNPACTRMLGYARDEVVGRSTAMFHRPEEAATLTRDALAATARDGVWRGDITFVRKDGTLGVCETVVKPLADDAGAVVGAVGVNRDVTDRRRAEDALRRSEERYRTLFESIDEGFCLLDVRFDAAGRAVDYTVVEMNPAFEKHTGLLGVVGRSIRQAVPDLEEFWFATYGRVAATGEPARFTHEARALGGRWFDVYAFRTGPAADRRVAVLFTDVTARRRAEDDRERLLAELTAAHRRKDEFLATLAHELRNPLAPVRNGVAALRLVGQPDAAVKLLDMVDRQVVHLVRLVDDLLDVSRVTTGKITLRPGPADLRAVIEAAVETSRPGLVTARHKLTVDLPADPLPVHADAARLVQVFTNLLTNAGKYTPDGGRVRVTAERDGVAVVARVADTGVGIPADMLAEVFEVFTQVNRTLDRAQGGLGLGLALVKQVVELHGGAVWADSPGIGHGATFTVRLPLAAGGNGDR